MRSGSTLTETMLDSHKNIWGLGEDSFFSFGISKLKNDLMSAGMLYIYNYIHLLILFIYLYGIIVYSLLYIYMFK